MGTLRRPPVAAWLAAIPLVASLCCCRLGGQSKADVVKLKLSSDPGSLTVENAGSTSMDLAAAVAVERWDQGRWIPVTTGFQLVSDCAQLQAPVKCVDLPPASNLRVVPWKGFSCSGQCNAACRANIYYGPGKFRFVVRSCDGSRKHVSETFSLPAKAMQ